MDTSLKIQAHYNFTDLDVKRLVDLRPVMGRYINEFPKAFFDHVRHFDQASIFLKDEEVIRRHQNGLREWFEKLFAGSYGPAYFADLEHIGLTHVEIDLKPHYVNAAMHFVKSFCIDIIANEFDNREERQAYIKAVEKIIDINLDVMTSSYIEEEKKKVFVSQKVEGLLISFSERFSHGLNLILVLGLVALGIMVMGLFVYDVTHIFQGNIEKGILGTLGSLLMLWVVIELVDTEIDHLRGEKFAIKVFVSVALVAVIRKILVVFLKSDAAELQFSLIAAILVLGVVYWLVSKVDKK